MGDGWDESRVVRAAARPRVDVLVERDARSFNRMDPDTKLIHSRLEEWAKAVKRAAGSRGYPPESIYVKWRLSGVRTETGHEPDLSDREAHVDVAVARLGDIDKAVIKRYYLAWRPVKIWQVPGIPSEHRFNVVLKRARWRVDGFLAAIEGPMKI